MIECIFREGFISIPLRSKNEHSYLENRSSFEAVIV